MIGADGENRAGGEAGEELRAFGFFADRRRALCVSPIRGFIVVKSGVACAARTRACHHAAMAVCQNSRRSWLRRDADAKEVFRDLVGSSDGDDARFAVSHVVGADQGIPRHEVEAAF